MPIASAAACGTGPSGAAKAKLDALIAINKFLAPVPLAPFWILVTYFAAQLLITRNSKA